MAGPAAKAAVLPSPSISRGGIGVPTGLHFADGSGKALRVARSRLRKTE